MNTTERNNIYNNYKTRIQINEIQIIEIDLTRSYQYNKNLILKNLDGKISTGYKGRKYYKSKGGIWAIRDNKGNFYDICETSSIVQEMMKDLQLFTTAKRDVRKDIYKNFKRQVYKRWKFQQIYKAIKPKKLYFVVLEFNENKEDRLNREIKYACKTKAKYWSPSPKQKNLIKEQ